MNQVDLRFKLDTGAEVTAITEQAYKALGSPKISQPVKKLCGPTSKPLKVTGRLTVSMSNKDHSCEQEIFVVNNLHHNLLGLPAIKALHLLTRVEQINTMPTIQQEFPSLFTGLGTLQEDPYTICLKPDAKPFSLGTARNISLPLREKVQETLNNMEAQGVISKVQQPTPWCAGMVVVRKKSGGVRICVDLKPLNKCVLRERHPLLRVDDTLAQLTGATTFSKLDANSGFWQIPLSDESKLLTTFITPFGRYCYNKLPFGITSAPEHFQRRMNSLLLGLQGVLCVMDDIIVFGKNLQEHNSRLQTVLTRLSASGITLNSEKCEFSKNRLTFLGHVIDSKGISPDPSKTAAITHMDPPKSITELRRFLGMINQLGKFTPNIAELSHPLRELLSVKRAWLWGPSQAEAFSKLKQELTSPQTLALYDPAADTLISADASSHGLGAVLMQKVENQWHPVSYASRSMTESETRYAQIEKEALASTWACEKFTPYIQGKTIILETDHKPLVPLLSHKGLDSLPPRILRFRLRKMRYDYEIKHVPGKLLHTADALSRAPLKDTINSNEVSQAEDIEFHMSSVISTLPVSDSKLNTFSQEQAEDSVCNTLISYCQNGWPSKSSLPSCMKPYWKFQGDFSLHGNLLLYQDRVTIPHKLQEQILQKLHQGHQGIQRCRLRAKSSVWWLNISRDINSFVQQCPECMKMLTPPREPLITSPLPSHPWEKVASDLFHLNNSTYVPDCCRLLFPLPRGSPTFIYNFIKRYQSTTSHFLSPRSAINICDWIWENMHSSHIRFCTLKDS